jgi:hypothetical protein
MKDLRRMDAQQRIDLVLPQAERSFRLRFIAAGSSEE